MYRDKLICFLLLCVNLSQGTVWDFGEDRRSSKIIDRRVGHMCAIAKIRRIPITVPACMKLINVRVEVDNPINPPAVYFNKDSKVVTIYYEPTQESRSTYEIVARGVGDKYCRDRKERRRKKNFWRPNKGDDN